MASNLITNLQDRLARTSAPVVLLSRRSGVAQYAIASIRDGKTKNPGVLTVEAISTALDSWEAEQGAKVLKSSEA